MAGARIVRTIAFAAGSIGGLSGAAYGLLNGQGRRAHSIITGHSHLPLNADGVYLPDGAGPFLTSDRAALTFAMLGDSLAAGVGAECCDRLPGVLLAKGLAEEAGRPVRLVTHAISGSRTHDLAAQVDRALINPPDLALVIIGGNDVTARSRIATSAVVLAHDVGRLVAAGTTVVMATCPDLGAVQPIPQPLRELTRRFSLALARAQRRAMDLIGVTTVSLADLVSPEFQARPDELFSPDRFHPNGAGYEFAANVLLHSLCQAATRVTKRMPVAA
ncbi:MAG TPA: SGNH/GDSL hydrolase family protein [Actinophytocola sp.]|uniref:SGNH/GDSL hydrolase family protein n=1 Tax=Actinophytocola sp. TaxID=1872138 RepID=UPI002DDDB3C9|nr:SGNH/GDSL hydrolase family protein [Actinophytocola sp.]HEV2778280.1 SGNH/GDSL hydrolase family protein [Actinophytocola sp.]